MKRKVIKKTLIAMSFMVSVLLGMSRSIVRDSGSVMLSDIEALSDSESYSDPIWQYIIIVQEGEIYVLCATGGCYCCNDL